LEAFFAARGWPYETSPLAGGRLDIRLGRHHGLSNGPNSVAQDLPSFLRYLREAPDAAIAADLREDDPERAIAERQARVASPVPQRRAPKDWRSALRKIIRRA
jgi:hypothetical protein